MLAALLPFLALAGFVLVPVAYWWDGKNTAVNDQTKESRKRTLVLASGAYAVLTAGGIAMAALHNDVGWQMLVSSCYLAVLLAIAAIVIGAGAGGWTRIAALTSGVILIGYLVFSMYHCDL